MFPKLPPTFVRIPAQVTKAWIGAGYRACPYEIKLDAVNMDILSTPGWLVIKEKLRGVLLHVIDHRCPSLSIDSVG